MKKFMKFKPNTKTLLVGFLVGIIFTCVLGAIGLPSSELASFGVVAPSGSLVVVRDRMGWAWVIEPSTATARGVNKATADEQSFLQLP